MKTLNFDAVDVITRLGWSPERTYVAYFRAYIDLLPAARFLPRIKLDITNLAADQTESYIAVLGQPCRTNLFQCACSLMFEIEFLNLTNPQDEFDTKMMVYSQIVLENLCYYLGITVQELKDSAAFEACWSNQSEGVFFQAYWGKLP